MMNVKRETKLCLSLMLMAFPVCLFAETPSLSTQTISLPSGPGSIEGLGESFEPQLNTGSYVFRLPFQLPPVRGRAQPEISLVYNSGNGNGPLGLGWNLRVPSVQRQTDKGLPRYDATDRFITGDGEELVARADGTYRRKVESDFTKWEILGTNGWQATRRDGTMLRYGQTAQSRQDRAPGETFRWMLESAEDTNGNRVEYDYIQDEGQIYLSEIRYGLHAAEPSAHYRISFDYDDIRPDAIADYRGRFRATTRLRLRAITAFLGARRIREWQLDYLEDQALTQLSRFTVFGDERTVTGPGAEKNVDYLPPIEFDYSPQQLGTNVAFVNYGPFMFVSLAAREAELLDLNRDGLPDLLLYEDGRYHSMVNRGPTNAFGPLTPFTSSVYYPPLNDPHTKLADLRGDGTLKILIEDNGETYYREFTSATTLGPDVDFTLPGSFPLTDPQVQTVDINNTRAMDFMAPGFNRFAFLVNGVNMTNYFFEGPVTPLANQIDFTAGWQFADMNGDRMPDLVAIDTVQGGGVVFYPGMGWGEFDAPVTMQGGPNDGDLATRGLAGLTLVDLDGDGLADLVQVDSGLVRIWPNRSGKAWGDPVTITHEQVPNWNEGGTAVRFVDINGNGSTDIVWNDPGAGIFLRALELHPHTKPNLLVQMRNGMGRTLDIEYRSSVDYMLEAETAGDPWTSRPPFPIPVVSAFVERDGMGSTYRTEVTYRNGYYDGPEREFRGFERAIQTELGNDSQGAPSLVTAFAFDTGGTVEALKGVVLESERRTTGGHVFQKSRTDWGHRALPGGLAPGENRPAVFAFATNEVTEVIEGGSGSPVTLRKAFDYDDYGNQTVFADYGRVEGANLGAWEDERIIRRDYTAAHPSGLTNWILSLPVTETVENLAGVIVAETRSFYDDPTFSGANTGQVSKGNLTLVRRAVDPGAGTFINASRQTYDAYGNPIHLLDPLGTIPGAPHSRTIAYDDQLHTHVVSETLHIGGAVPQVSLQAAYDLGLGVITNSVDFNGHGTDYHFDPFGRLSAIIKPGDTHTHPTEEYDYRLGMPIAGGRIVNWIETRIREEAGGGTIDSRVFFDGLTRQIMRRAEGETNGQIVVTDTVVFNDRRTQWKTYLPYFETGILDFSEPTFATPFQEMHYDAVGRQLALYQPDTGQGRPVARVHYEPLAYLKQDEEQTRPGSPHFGCGMRYVEDGLRDKEGKGRLRVVEEIVKISPEGDPLAEPVANWTGYTDSQGNQKHFLYDGLSRKVFMDDPDRGHYWWVYDDVGNVLRTCDAKNQHLAYAHDGANRILAEWHLAEGTGGVQPLPGVAWFNPPSPPETEPDVAYHYDLPAGPIAREAFWRPKEAAGIVSVILDRLDGSETADVNQDGVIDVRDVALRANAEAVGATIEGSNTLGRLAWVRDSSGQEHISYDERGRAVWKVKRFDLAEEPQPLAFYVENQFDSADRLTRHVYADGTFVVYRYNPRGLLDSVSNAIDAVSYNPAGQNARIALANGVTTELRYDDRLRVSTIESVRRSDGLALQDLSYAYDAISNITGIGDHRPDSQRTTLLSEAGIPGLTGSDLSDSLAFSYDSLYRITSAVGPAHGTHGYRYDPIGNMVGQFYSGDTRFQPPERGTLAHGERGYGPHVLTTLTTPEGQEIPLAYDANGSMTNLGEFAWMRWDPKNRLMATGEGETVHSHIFDYSNRRAIHRQDSNGVSVARTLYVDQVSEFRDGRLVKYVYVGNLKVARMDFSTPTPQPVMPDLFFLHDHLGSTTMAMDGHGLVRQLCSYAPFGHERFNDLHVGRNSIDYSFGGKELHKGPDLSYFEARFLRTSLGRFISVDPLAADPKSEWLLTPQALNHYAYCVNRPIVCVDPTGLAHAMLPGETFSTLPGEFTTSQRPQTPTTRQPDPTIMGFTPLEAAGQVIDATCDLMSVATDIHIPSPTPVDKAAKLAIDLTCASMSVGVGAASDGARGAARSAVGVAGAFAGSAAGVVVCEATMLGLAVPSQGVSLLLGRYACPAAGFVGGQVGGAIAEGAFDYFSSTRTSPSAAPAAPTSQSPAPRIGPTIGPMP